MSAIAQVDVVIVNYRVSDRIEKLLQSLESMESVSTIWIVDNWSTECERNNLLRLVNKRIGLPSRKSIEVLQPTKNMGFSRANNFAIAEMERRSHLPDYIWFLNPDTIPNPDAITAFLKKASEQKQPTIFGGTIVENGRFLPGGGRVRSIPGVVKPNQKFEYISGACIFCRYRDFKTIGNFPERYFLYWEDVDWSFTARSKGFALEWVEAAVVFHEGSASVRPQSGFQYRVEMGSAVKFCLRWNVLMLISCLTIKPFWNMGSYVKRTKSLSLSPLINSWKGIIDAYSDK